TGNHIDNGAWYKKRRNTTRATLYNGHLAVFNRLQTTNAGTDSHTNTLGILLGNLQTRVTESLHTGSNAILDKQIHFTGIFFRKEIRRIKILYHAGKVRAVS